MARIAGVDLPRDKRGIIAVQYIYGIGIPSARRIMADARRGRQQAREEPGPTTRPRASATSSSASTRSKATCAARWP